MKLLTKEVEKKFTDNPLYSHDEKLPQDVAILAKFFAPSGRYTFYVTEANQEGDDYLMFGFCASPLGSDCDELGYVTLSELQAIKLPYGLGIERDRNYAGTLIEAYKEHGFTKYEGYTPS